MLTLWLTVPAGLLAIAGVALSYVASPQQQWRAQGSWPRRGRPWLALACLLASLALFLPTMGRAAAVFTWLTLVMLSGTAAPFFGAWRGRVRRLRA
ncbi:hypothetical protein [Tahibacter caeni]|uniref:hypothetical protein n=1 Tax=Tahibacter caeni TaxID=1453545 RepID=UPI0021478327|nr:hypothetical protein [Tahibacter caeni]